MEKNPKSIFTFVSFLLFYIVSDWWCETRCGISIFLNPLTHAYSERLWLCAVINSSILETVIHTLHRHSENVIARRFNKLDKKYKK